MIYYEESKIKAILAYLTEVKLENKALLLGEADERLESSQRLDDKMKIIESFIKDVYTLQKDIITVEVCPVPISL